MGILTEIVVNGHNSLIFGPMLKLWCTLMAALVVWEIIKTFIVSSVYKWASKNRKEDKPEESEYRKVMNQRFKERFDAKRKEVEVEESDSFTF